MRHDYEEQDVQEILQRAVRVDARLQGGREQLLKNAQELGISEEAVARAEAEYFREKTEKEEMDAFVRERKRGYWEHLTSYIIINAFLILLNLLTSKGHFWAIYPLLGWGIGIAFHTFHTFSRNSEEFQQDFKKWKRKRQKERDGVESGDDDDDD